jgi:hypothetical protein
MPSSRLRNGLIVMLKFLVFTDGRPAESWPLRNAYLIGSDRNAMRCDIAFEPGVILCQKREPGPASLALQHPVADLGEMTIQTCLLPERDEPYILSLELARHRLMTLYAKLEDWAMLDLQIAHPVTKRSDLGRKRFVEALCVQREEPAEADKIASECLLAALDGSEELALAHAELLLNKRKSSGALPKHLIGCGVGLEQTDNRVRLGLQTNFDFVYLPMPWKALSPEESEYSWQAMDNWAQWSQQSRMPLIAGPIISFEPSNLPDWLYIWEHDYDTVRDLIYEHIERVVSRYRNIISVWNIASGLHVNSHFSFNFEQLMDLTRMATMLVKKTQPSAKVIIELREPFGEYYSSNPRSIPPLMYADLVVQAGVAFDLFGIKLPMGQALPGQYTRDLMQISSLLDQFSHFGKPIALSVAAPSEPVTDMMIAAPESGEPVDPNSGYWRRPWSEVVQSHWLEAVFQIALSKPIVESITWQSLLDNPQIDLPLAGLISEDIQPKDAFRRLVTFRETLCGTGHNGAPEVTVKYEI